MASHPDKPTRFRVSDETTGTTPNDAVVAIAAVEVIGREIVIIGSDLVRPPVPIPPQASAIHHITDEDVAHCPQLEDVLVRYMDIDGADGVDALVAHSWAFEGQWLNPHLQGRPTICTYKAALRVWPSSRPQILEPFSGNFHIGLQQAVLALPANR